MQDQRAKDPVQQQKSALPLSAIDPNVAANLQNVNKEPTEVILFGFGFDHQWAAIEYFERVSNGCIYEDYDRHPPHQRYDQSMSFNRAKLQRVLSQAALKKRNAYRGGDHWIKVTFDSPEAAELACSCSPHAVHGHLVYAEPYRGTGPPDDAAIPYSNAGAQLDTQSLPKSFSTNTLSADTLSGSPESSNTLSSATITGPAQPSQSLITRSITTPSLFAPGESTALQASGPTGIEIQKRPLRVPGAKRAVLLPAEQALLPPKKDYSGALGTLKALAAPWDLVGGQVPRLEDGSFDWKTASLYWCFFAWLDSIFGTDICGLKGDD